MNLTKLAQILKNDDIILAVGLVVIVCMMIAFAIAVGLLMNASTQVDRYNDPYYIQSRIG